MIYWHFDALAERFFSVTFARRRLAVLPKVISVFRIRPNVMFNVKQVVCGFALSAVEAMVNEPPDSLAVKLKTAPCSNELC